MTRNESATARTVAKVKRIVKSIFGRRRPAVKSHAAKKGAIVRLPPLAPRNWNFGGGA